MNIKAGNSRQALLFHVVVPSGANLTIISIVTLKKNKKMILIYVRKFS